MANRKKTASGSGVVVPLTNHRDLTARRAITIDLPEFVICALESKVAAVNAAADVETVAQIDDYVESELVNLITVRDVALLEQMFPGFARAVNEWLRDASC